MTTYAEKLLPHDTEAEEAVLGSILIDGECLTRLAPLLKQGDFSRERNQLCFDAAMSLFQRDQAVDQITLAGELARTEKLDLVGGMAYLSHLVSITPTSVHAEDYAQVVSRTSNMRRLIDAGNRIVNLGYTDTEDIEITMRQAEDALFTVRARANPAASCRSRRYTTSTCRSRHRPRPTRSSRGCPSCRDSRTWTNAWEGCSGPTWSSWAPVPPWERAAWPSTWRSTPPSPARPAVSSAWR